MSWRSQKWNVPLYLHLFSVLIEIITLLRICITICLILVFCGKALPRHNFTLICWSIKWVLWSTARILLKLYYSTYLRYGFHFNRYIAQKQIPCSAVTFNKVVVTNNKVIATITQWVNPVPPYVPKLHFMYEVVRTSKCRWFISQCVNSVPLYVRTKTPLYVRIGSYIKQISLEHLSYIG